MNKYREKISLYLLRRFDYEIKNLIFETKSPFYKLEKMTNNSLNLSLNNNIISTASIDDVIGKKINIASDGSIPPEEWKRLSDYLSIYSDKRYETARFLFIKDGIITDQILTSSGIPTTTFPYPSNDFLFKYENYARRSGSRIVFIHNHPSGIVLPSDADKEFTAMLSASMKNLFCGHIILDHGSSGIYLNNENRWFYNVDGIFMDESSYINKGARKTYLSNIQNYINSENKDLDLAVNLVNKLDAGSKWNMENFTTCVFLRENNLVESLHMISDSEFGNYKTLSLKLKEIGWNDGATKLILFPTSMEQYREAVLFNNEEHIVYDILLPDEAEVAQRRKKLNEKSYTPPSYRLFNSDDARKIFKYESTTPILSFNKMSYNIDIKNKLKEHGDIKMNENVLSENLLKKIEEKTFNMSSISERTEEQQDKIANLLEEVTFRPGTTTGADSEYSRIQRYFNAFDNPEELIKILEIAKDMGTYLFDVNGMSRLVEEYISREIGLMPRYEAGELLHSTEEPSDEENNIRNAINLYSYNIVNGNSEYLEVNRITNQSQLFKRLYELDVGTLEDRLTFDSKRNERLQSFIEDNNFDELEMSDWNKLSSDPRFESILPDVYSLVERYGIKPENISLYELFDRINKSLQREYESNLNSSKVSENFSSLRGRFLNLFDHYNKTYHVRNSYLNKTQTDKIKAFFDFENHSEMEYIYLKQIKNLGDEYQLADGEKMVFENMAMISLNQPVLYGKFANFDNGVDLNADALFSVKEIASNFFNEEESKLKDGKLTVEIKNIYDLKAYLDSDPQRVNDDHGWALQNSEIINAANLFTRSTKELRSKGILSDEIDAVEKEILAENLEVIKNVNVLDQFEFNPKSQEYNEEKLIKVISEKLVTQKNVKKNLYENQIIKKIKAAGIEVVTDKEKYSKTLNRIIETNVILEMLEDNPLKIEKGRSQLNADSIPTKNNIIDIRNNQEYYINKIESLKHKIENNEYDGIGFLKVMQSELFSINDSKISGYYINEIENNFYKFRLSDHKAIISDRQGEKTLEESVVIQFCDNKGRVGPKGRLVEFYYKPENLTKEKMISIINGIQDWIKTGEFSGIGYDSYFISSAEEIRRNLTSQNMVLSNSVEWNYINHTQRAWIEKDGHYFERSDDYAPEYRLVIDTSFPDLEKEYGYYIPKEAYFSFDSEHELNNYLKENYQFSIVDNNIYGFVYNGKIYLNPEFMNSNVAVHEYTHLWDAYTQQTNPELWNKGLSIFKNTRYWEEVVADPNYQDIKDDENLVLSEIHSRICGKMAEKVLDRISELDGEQKRLESIDWDKETWSYIYNEIFTGFEQNVSEDSRNVHSDIAEFLSMPMKDLLAGKDISIKAGISVQEPSKKPERGSTFASLEAFNSSIAPEEEQNAGFTIHENINDEPAAEDVQKEPAKGVKAVPEEEKSKEIVHKVKNDPSATRPNSDSKMTVKEFLEGALLCKSMAEYEAYYNKNFHFTNIDVIQKDNLWQIQEVSSGKGLFIPLNDKNEAFRGMMELCKQNPLYNNVIPSPEKLKESGGIKKLDYVCKFFEKSYGEKIQVPENKQPVTFNPNEIEDEKIRKVFGVVDIELIKKFVQTDESPYIKGTPVPDFGHIDQNNLKVIQSGWIFYEENSQKGSVVFKRNNNGVIEMMEMEKTAYENLINRSKEFVKTLSDDMTLQKRIEDYYKYQDSISSGDRQIRQNTADQFWHNFQVMCYQKASNEQDAMDIVKEIYVDMPPAQKERIKQIEMEYKDKTGDTFEKRIYRKFNEIMQERKIEHQHREALVKAEIDSKVNALNPDNIDSLYLELIQSEEEKLSRSLSFEEKKSLVTTAITNEVRAKADTDPEKNYSTDPGARTGSIIGNYDVQYSGKVDESLSVSIGDTIKYKGIKIERFPGASSFFKKRVKILPLAEYKVRAVSKELGIITLENDKGNIYRLNLQDFIKVRAKTERKIQKDQLKEQKKEKSKEDYYYGR